MCDIPKIILKFDISKEIEVINLGVWNDGPLGIEAIKDR